MGDLNYIGFNGTMEGPDGKMTNEFRQYMDGPYLDGFKKALIETQNRRNNMTPYSQNLMQGDPYGNSDSYYDPQTGVASIGYGAPKKRRLIAIRNGKEIYEGDFDAPFEDASVSNEAAARRASAFNAQGNSEYMAQQEQLRAQPDGSMLNVLMQKYNQQKAPSYSRFGNEFMMNGQKVTDDIEGTAKQAGMSADDYIQNQYSQAKAKAAEESMKRLSGDALVGTSQAKALLQDPQFLSLDDDSKQQLYSQIYGRQLRDDLAADKYGGNLTANQLAAKMNMGKSAEAASGRLKSMGVLYDAPALELEQYFDPNTGFSNIPQGYVEDDNNPGKFHPKPARQIRVSPAEIQMIRDLKAKTLGYENYNSMNQDIGSREEQMSLLAQKQKDMANIVPASVRAAQYVADPLAMMGQENQRRAKREKQRPALEGIKADRLAAARQAATRTRAQEIKALQEMEQYQRLMQERQTYQPQVNYLRGF